MNTLYGWLRSMFLSLPEESDLLEASIQTADDAKGCQIFSDALEQAGLELDELTARIGDLMDQYWACQKERVRAESVGTEDARLQRFNMTQQSINGAKLLLLTSANRVRQVVNEIEIVTQRDTAE
ncbi:MAG: hypothetical protein ACK6EB_03605 [Planctomyces sp.]|jgi:hypothetical protein